MKKLFLFLLEKYTKTEEDRLIVFNILHDKVSDTYSEQTTFGNVLVEEIRNQVVKEQNPCAPLNEK